MYFITIQHPPTSVSPRSYSRLRSDIDGAHHGRERRELACSTRFSARSNHNCCQSFRRSPAILESNLNCRRHQNHWTSRNHLNLLLLFLRTHARLLPAIALISRSSPRTLAHNCHIECASAWSPLKAYGI